MLGVKICGLSTPQAVDVAVGGGATHVGFVFFPPSPRHLELEQARALAARVPEHIKKVGVFVTPAPDLLEAAIAAASLDVLQLHKVEPQACAAARGRTALETWAALPVRMRSDLHVAANFRHAVDRLVFDAKTPEGGLPGGIGLRFDWRLLDGFDHSLPWALSGGLDANNLSEAVGITNARMVDVSSGVESAPGVKDVDKIQSFLQVARNL